MKYFIPEWDDRVDPDYDFINDRHSREHRENPIENDVYTWNIFGIEKAPIDGVLVSRVTITGNKKKLKIRIFVINNKRKSILSTSAKTK